MLESGMAIEGEAGRVLLAPDKFKGSLTAPEVARALAAGLRQARPATKITIAPIADGGEGTVDAAVSAGFQLRTARVAGPLGHAVQARWAVREDAAIIELAQASGLGLLAGQRLRPLDASSHGTGQLISAALDAGCAQIVLAVGGSASTDGGAGLLQALGAQLRDGSGAVCDDVLAATELDLSRLDGRLASSTFLLACDVDNGLLGAAGAARVFGPQKGATPVDVQRLEERLLRWAGLVEAAVGRDCSGLPGAGAAGGVGFAALAVLDAQPRPGIELMLELTGFGQLVENASLVITGEGQLDEASLGGKAPVGVARAAARAGVPVLAVVGRSCLSAEQLAMAGFADCYQLADLEPDAERGMRQAGSLLEQLAVRIAERWLG